MSKNRSTWSVLLAVVLAMVVMAGLAVTSFAETDSGLTPVADRDNLVAVLNGEVAPTDGINYDVDGNGIVEMDDLAAFDGTQEDLLPNGEKDAFSICNQETITAKTSSAIVRGDSSMSIVLDSEVGGYAWIEWIWYDEETGDVLPTSMLDISGWKELTFDTLWTNGVGTLYLNIYNDAWETYSITIEATEAGWTTNVIDLLEVPAEFKSIVAMEFTWDDEHEVYIDNLQTNIELVYVPVNFNSAYGSAAGIEVISGTPYGELPELVHTFKNFEGWYLDQAYTQKVTADTIVAAEAEHTLYAKWSNVVGEDGKITVTEKGNNTFELKQDYANYKQIRFNFTLVSGNFSMDYTDGDTNAENDPIVAIVDVNGNTVQPSKVKAGVEYTAVIHGGSVITTAGIITAGEISGSGTLQFAADAELKITNLEAIGGQLGFTMLGSSDDGTAVWKKVDLTSYGYSYGYEFHMNGNSIWNSRIGLSVAKSRYTKLTYDFCVYEHATASTGETFDMSFSGMGLVPTVYDMAGNEVAAADMVIGTWYRLVVDLTGKTGSQYIYSYSSDAAVPEGKYKAYIANVFFKGDGDMIDNLAPSVTVNKSGADGTFVTTPITRDTDRGTYRVAGTSASWTDRALKVTMNDPSKELVQMDIRFLTSKDANGKDVAPTLTVSSTVTGNIKTAQYVILDENDVPVTAMETGKWYRLFITTAGGSGFAVAPATSGEVVLQVKNLDAFQADEMAMSMVSDNTNVGTASIILTRFGKLEYAYAGTDANSASIRLNSNLYKQVRFSFQLKDRVTTLSMTGATLVVKDASGNTVSMATLQPNTWYTAVIFNGGNALPQSLTLNVAGKTSLLIKDVAGYQTMDDPTSATMSDKYHGLEADEMMIAGFVGPRDEEYVVSYRYDQKTGNLPSMARDDIFKMLSDAGFNYIIDHGLDYAGSGVESVSKLLRLAAKYGMNYFVHATDIAEIGTVTATDTSGQYSVYTYYNHLADWADFKAKLDEMTQYESFGGLYLRDEPSADLFEVIRDARIRVTEWYNAEKGTNLNVFSNLLPGVGSHRWTNGKNTITVGDKSYRISTWQDYISAYEDIVDPDYMMVDMYPFAGDEGIIEGTFIEYISRMAKTAQDQGKDWMGCVQVGGGELAYGAKRVANEYETNWDVNAMLAFGVRGLTYYTMVSAPYFGGTVSETDPAYNDHSLLNIKGEKTVYYDYAKKINAHVQAVDHILMNASQIGIIFVGDQLTYTGGTGNNNAPYNYADKCRDDEHIPMITKDGTYKYSGTLGIEMTGNDAKKYSDVKLSNVIGDHVMIGAFSYDDTIALYVVNNDIIAREGNDTSDNIQLSFTGSYAYEIIQDGLTSWQTGNAVNLNLELGHAAMIVLRDAGSVNMDASVFFNLNYETSAPAPETIIIPLDGTYPELPALKRDFYTFEGWYLNAEGTGEAVKEGDALAIQGSHILYAKWTYHEDNNPLQFNLNTEKDHVSITRQYIDGVETYVYTTEGKTLVNAAWQRRIGFVLGDTSKEVVKFRMKVVSSITEAGETVNPDFYFYAGGLADVNSGHMAIVDANDNVVHTVEAGKWYTVYALSQGKSDLSMFVANSCTENLLITLQIQDREVLDYEPEVGIMTPSHSWYGEAAPYQDAEGNWLVHHRSFTGEHHANSAWNRRLNLKNPNGFETVSFEFRYNVSQFAAAGAELADNVTFAGLSMTYYDMNGLPVAAADLKVGQWYKAVVGGTPAASTDWYAMGYADGTEGKTVNIDMDFRNIKGIPADNDPIKVGVRDKTNLSIAVDYVDGKHIYTTTTRGVSNPGTGAWQWGTQINVPMEAEYFAVTFRITEAYAADGVTALRPSMSAWQTDLSSGTSAWIVEAETGKIISTDNGSYADGRSDTHTLELGKWYTIISNTPHASSDRYFLFPCQQYSGKALITMEISDRSYIVPQDITVDTPDSYGWPYPIYSVEDGWHYTIFENTSTYNAWQRRTDINGVAGAKSVEFEVRINSVSGGCTYRLGTTESLREFYDLETGEYLGFNNDVVLEAGKWYKVIAYNGTEGALMGDSFRVYPGDATHDGNVSVSFRNFEAIYPDRVEVSFNLNYEGATDAPATILVAEGSAYGTLPTPTREGFSFIGWFTEAECTNKVTETTIVTAEHTLYAKWDENTAVDPILTAVNSALLKKATEEQKTAAGIAAAQSMYVYTKAANTSSDNLGDAAIYFSNQEGYNYITFDFYYADMTAGLQEGRPYLNLKAYEFLTNSEGKTTMLDSDLELVVINHRTGEITHAYPNVIDGAHTWGLVDLNTWYTVTVKTADWSRVNFAIWTSGAANVYFTNIYGHDEFTAPDPVEGPTINAARPDQMSIATSAQLTAAGIFDTSSTTFRYTKITGVDAAASRIYLENRNSDAYVTFDVRYSAFNNTSDPGAGVYLLVHDGANYLATGNGGMIVVKKGTETQAGVFSGVYNVLELNTWYTVAIPVQNLSSLYMCFNGADTATMFISNIVWGDEPVFAPILGEDTSLAKPSYTTETARTGIYRELIGGKETIIYSTYGKTAPNEGDYQRRMQFNLEDTSKELIKFRFKYVTFQDAEGNDVAPKMDFYAGGVMSNNRGNFVIVDEDCNVVAPTALEIGKWYTFYGRTLGNTSVSVWPTYNYGTQALNVTMFIQDRELVDFEPTINIRQENHSWQGNTAPYQDAEGNWLFHYRSFTGEQNNNTGWNRRTYIDIPDTYSFASFEFRFNVSQYAASGAELADRIEAFYGMSDAVYTDMEGNVINAKDMVVGQWYKVLFSKISYFIAMSDVNSGDGAVVNIDMDIRNVQGYAFDYSFEDSYYVKHSNTILDGKLVTKFNVAHNGDPTYISNRRIVLNLPHNTADVVTMQLLIAECSGTPSIQVTKASGDRAALVVTNAAGNVVDSNNLELNQWYTVTWLASNNEQHEIRVFDGEKATGVYYLTDITATTVENPFTASSNDNAFAHYTQILPYEDAGETRYLAYVRPHTDGTNEVDRRFVLHVENSEPQLVSFQMMYTGCSEGAIPSIKVLRDDGAAIDWIVLDENGEPVDNTNMQLNQWYTVAWFGVGHGKGYRICPLTGSAASGSIVIKNINVEDAFSSAYYLRAATFELGGDTLYWGHSRPNDNTGIGYRSLKLNIDSAAGNIISLQMKMVAINANGTPNVRITNAAGTDMALTIKDQGGNEVAATEMQLGQWYNISWIADGSATYNLLSFNGNGVQGDYLLKALHVELVNMGRVTFDLNYAGATNAPAAIVVAAGSAYGELPTPDARVGYTFEGWMLADGTVVNAATTVSDSHTLYAKWTIVADTSLLQPSYTTETYFNSVSRDFVDGKDTIIYTTNGKPAPTEGDYQKRMQLNVGDTTKELVKLRFQFVTFNDANGSAAVPKLDFYTGGVTSGYRGNFVIVDENYNVVAPTALETGKWYTFYGVTRGFNYVTLWPTYSYGKANMDVTLYVQDRELVDFEPTINIRQEGNSWQGNTAPYQDAEGNWLFHYRSFTSEHHDNNGWNRRTYIDIPADYTHASFEFRFNVSQQAASGEELADRIEAFYGLSGAVYTNMDGEVIAAKDMVVGQWYRVTFQKISYFIAMSDVGGTVNIDMDIRNVVGYNPNGYSMVTHYDGYANPVLTYSEADGWHYYIANNGNDTVSAWDRRTYLNTPVDGRYIVYEAKINNVSGSANARLVAPYGVQAYYDIETGELLGSNSNTFYLETGKWYKVVQTVNADKSMGSSFHLCYPGGDGGAGNASVSFRNFEVIASDFRFGYDQGQNAAATAPIVIDGQQAFRYKTVATNITNDQWARRLQLSFANNAGDLVSMKVQIVSVKDNTGADSGVRTLNLREATPLFLDENGKVIANADLQLGKWYTMTWTATGAATYNIWMFSGYAEAEVLFKDVSVSALENEQVKFNMHFASAGVFKDFVPAMYEGQLTYIANGAGYTSATQEHKQVNMTVADERVMAVSFEFKTSAQTGNANAEWWDYYGKIAIYEAETGVKIDASQRSTMKADTWYIAYYNTGSALGTSSINIGYLGGTTGGLDLYIRNVKTYTARVISSSESYIASNITYGEDGIEYNFKSATTVTGDARLVKVALPTGNKGFTMQIKYDACTLADDSTYIGISAHCFSNGAPVSALWYDEDGNVATTKELGKWYTVVVYGSKSSDNGFWVYFNTAQAIKDLNVTIKNLRANDVIVTPDSAVTLTHKVVDGESVYTYKTAATNNPSTRAIYFRNDGTKTTLTYKVKFTTSSLDGVELFYLSHYTNGNYHSPVVTDEAGNVVEQADRQAGVWYNVTLTAPSGSTFSETIYTFTYGLNSDTTSNADVQMEIKDVQIF